MTEYVLDSSVAVKWILPLEPLRIEAFRIFADFNEGYVNLLVPDLFWAEIANVLWKAVRGGRIAKRTADIEIEQLRTLGIPTFPNSDLYVEAFELAISFNRSGYDATYLALAMSSRRVLLTADERLFNAVGSRLPVRWLGSIL